MNQKQRRLLLRLANFLGKKVPESGFNLEHYFVECSRSVIDDLRHVVAGEENCGSTACAIGWLPIALPKYVRFHQATGAFSIKKAGQFSSRKSFQEATKELFGINQEAFYFLFMPDLYHPKERGPTDVARRIHRFLKQGLPRYCTYYVGNSCDRDTVWVFGFGSTDQKSARNIACSPYADGEFKKLQKELGFPLRKAKSVTR